MHGKYIYETPHLLRITCRIHHSLNVSAVFHKTISVEKILFMLGSHGPVNKTGKNIRLKSHNKNIDFIREIR